MGSTNSFILKIKRGESPVYRFLGKIARKLLAPTAIRVPRVLKPPLRLLYEAHYAVVLIWNMALNVFYRHPLFQARCASFGQGVAIDRLPFVNGHVEIHIGNHVHLGGGVAITSGRFVDKPRLILKDHSEVGWNSMIVLNQEVVIEEYARVS